MANLSDNVLTLKGKSIDLSLYGISNVEKIYYNSSFEELFEHEMDPSLEGFERGVLTKTGAVSVDTGIFTGRSPKDKYIVHDAVSENTVWWSTIGKNDNRPITPDIWAHLKGIVSRQLSNKKLYVVDAFAGANPDSRLSVRFIMEVAWQAHFVKNMFIRPSDKELENFKPDFVLINGAKAVNPQIGRADV